jgi:hypothetical protein
VVAAGIEPAHLDFLPHRATLCGQDATVPPLKPDLTVVDHIDSQQVHRHWASLACNQRSRFQY